MNRIIILINGSQKLLSCILSSQSDNTSEKPIRGDIIKKSFDEIDFLPKSTIYVMLKDIDQHQIILDDKHYYSLSVIAKHLGTIFGEQMAQIMVARLQTGIQALKSIAITLMPIAAMMLACTAVNCACAVCELICKCTGSSMMM